MEFIIIGAGIVTLFVTLVIFSLNSMDNDKKDK